MKTMPHGKPVFSFLVPLLCALFLTVAGAEESKKESKDKGLAAMVINADSLEIDNKEKIVIFEGNVSAIRDNITIRCQRMQLHYIDLSGKGGLEESDIDVEKIVASGEVKIERDEGGMATAEEAVYYQKEEKLILTGDPVVKQGDDFVEGAKITLFLKEDRSLVEGSPQSKVRAVISPRSLKQR
jgi:lipopolysaccharide export system protein LptA